MNLLTQTQGYWFLLFFGLAMVLVTYIFSSSSSATTSEGFLVSDRGVSWWVGGASIAASWVWAPALFISVQLAYQKGLAGIFWFTLPNVIALLLFAFFALRIREVLPRGYTLPQYIKFKLKSDRVHKVYLVPYLFYQLMAVTVQLFAGGSLVVLLTGIPLWIVMPILAVIALAYTLISGFKATLITDFFQMFLILVIGFATVIWASIASGGISTIVGGLSGLEGTMNIFDPGIAFSLGVVTSIGLIAGAISDQQYWQRAFAIKKGQLRKAFIFGASLFALVPSGLSVLGFIAANPSSGVSVPEGVDVSMVGVQTVSTFLPNFAVIMFVIMLLAGLCSTLDSALSATSSLWVTDISKKGDKSDSVRSARKAMLAITCLGLLVAYAVMLIPQFGLFHLWWIFNTVAATVVVPTILSLYWDGLDAKGVFWGVLVSFFVGLPLFIYGNIINDPIWTVGSTLFIIFISTSFCLFFSKK